MRRVFLLALLALAVPATSLASNIDFGNEGTLGVDSSMTFMLGGSSTNCTTATNCVVAGGTLNITSPLVAITQNGMTTTGMLGTVSVTTGTLIALTGPACTATACFSFSGGTLNVFSSSHALLFSGTFTGTLDLTHIGLAGWVYSLQYTPGGKEVVSGFQVAAVGFVSGDSVVSPEPGTLGLLGSGLIGLATMARRLKRAT